MKMEIMLTMSTKNFPIVVTEPEIFMPLLLWEHMYEEKVRARQLKLRQIILWNVSKQQQRKKIIGTERNLNRYL